MYDRYIQDQEKMLDNLYSQTEEWVNARLDNIDGLISSAIESTNQNSDSIRETLEIEAENVGLTFTENMNSIWGDGGSFTSIVAEYGNDFTAQLTTVNGTLANIQNYVAGIVGASDKEASSTVGNISSSTDSVTSITAPATPPPSSSSSSNGSSSSSSSNKTTSTTSPASKPKVSAISRYLKYGSRGTDVGTLQKALNMIQNAGLKVDNIFGSKTQSALKKFQGNVGVSKDGILGPKTKAKFKAKGYAKGTKRIASDQWAWTQDEKKQGGNQELIYRVADGAILTPLRAGDKVWSSEDANRLWELSHDKSIIDSLLGKAAIPSINDNFKGNALQNISNISNVMSNNMSGDMNFHIEMNGVNDPQQFAVQLKHALLYNQDVNKMVQNVAFSKAMGKNSLGKFNYR